MPFFFFYAMDLTLLDVRDKVLSSVSSFLYYCYVDLIYIIHCFICLMLILLHFYDWFDFIFYFLECLQDIDTACGVYRYRTVRMLSTLFALCSLMSCFTVYGKVVA